MRDWSRSVAAGLVALGIRPGEHVAVVLANCPEFVAVKFGIARAGAVAVPINCMFKRAELGYVLRQSDARILITMDRFRDLDYLAALDHLAPDWQATGGGESLPKLRHVVLLAGPERQRGGALSLAELERLGATDDARDELARREALAVDPHAPADVIYTSGTTGVPKGVILTHDMLLRTAYASAYTRAFQDGRRIFFALPLYHVFGYVEALLPVLFVGGAVIPHATFDPGATLRAIDAHRADEAMFVPTMTMAVIDELHAGRYDLSSLSAVFSSAGQSPVRIWRQIRDELGVAEIFTAYGMTETTASTTCTLPDDPLERLAETNGCYKPAGVAGDPSLDGHLALYKTVDPATGEDLPPGTEGELAARGPICTPAYYNKPEETAAIYDADGWMRTGDLGRIAADGYLTLTGRIKEAYKCGGELVVPKEIEDVLTTHPAVSQAYVVGIPHERMGEVGCAWVVPRDELPNPEELIRYCAERLARFKVPAHVLCLEGAEVPTSASGKAQKFLLVERAVASLAQAVP
jgi:fatty-acyl-CoA synthase